MRACRVVLLCPIRSWGPEQGEGDQISSIRSACARRLVAVVAVLGLVAAPASAQHESGAPAGVHCFLVADKGNYPGDNDLLAKIDTRAASPAGSAIGSTGTVGIEALAMRPTDGVLFTADEDVLGTIDAHTGRFTATTGQPFGTGTGTLGSLALNNADGLSFDPSDGALYASIRRGSDREDLLIKVDARTGVHVNDAFGADRDYAVVPAPGGRDDIDDITFDSQGQLWAVVTDKVSGGSSIVRLDKKTGQLVGEVRPIGGHADAVDMEALAWGSEQGTPRLFGMNGRKASGSTEHVTRLWTIDPATGTATLRSTVSGSGLSSARDYEGIACAMGSVAAYVVEVSPVRALGGAETTAQFTVTVRRSNRGVSGDRPVVQPSGGAIVENTCASLGTDGDGRCTVTIAGPRDAAGRAIAGTSALTVTSGNTAGVRGLDWASTTATRLWVGLGGCLEASEPGKKLPLKVTVTIPDTDPAAPGAQGLKDVTVTNDLPAGVIVSSAESLAGAAPTIPAPGTPGGRVRWRVATLAAGTYAARVYVDLASGLADGTALHDTVTVEAATYLGAAVASRTMIVTKEGRARAFAVSGELAGGILRPGTAGFPDSDAANNDELASIPNLIPGTATPLARAVFVSESSTITPTKSEVTAITKASELDLNVPGVVRVQADAVIARATATAGSSAASATSAGSIISNLRINGVSYGDIGGPTSIRIADAAGDPWIEVHLLERALSGIADPQASPPPPGTPNRAGIALDAIRVHVRNSPQTPFDEVTDIRIAHAEAFAGFGPTVDCRVGPALGAHAAVARGALGPDAAASVGEVVLPAAGGTVATRLSAVTLPAGTAEAGEATASGTVASTTSADTQATAQLADVSVADRTVRARSIEVASRCALSGCSGDTTVSNLVVGGTVVCNALGLTSTCEPAPNTVVLLPTNVLVLLNEQVGFDGGLTVNAVHLFVLGRDNPLGLPAGADLVLGSAQALTRAR